MSTELTNALDWFSEGQLQAMVEDGYVQSVDELRVLIDHCRKTRTLNDREIAEKAAKYANDVLADIPSPFDVDDLLEAMADPSIVRTTWGKVAMAYVAGARGQ